MKYRKIKSLKFLYEISSNGEVRNIKSKKVLKPYFDKDGYKKYTFNQKCLGTIKKFEHQLVMEAWGEAAPSLKHQIDHIDRNKQNNNISNLRWVTVKENAQNRDNSIYKNKFSKEDYEKSSDAISRPITNGELKFKNSYKAAEYIKEKFNLTSKTSSISNHIRNCANGNRKIAYKNKWYFI